MPVPPTTNHYPGLLKWAVALLVAGGIANVLYSQVSPTAGYLTVFIILIGLAVTDNWQSVTSFFNELGLGG